MKTYATLALFGAASAITLAQDEEEYAPGQDFVGDLADGLVDAGLLTREDADFMEADLDEYDLEDALIGMDANGDGEVDLDEGASAIIEEFGLEDTEETREEIKGELKERLGAYDQDGSGALCIDEVLAEKPEDDEYDFDYDLDYDWDYDLDYDFDYDLDYDWDYDLDFDYDLDYDYDLDFDLDWDYDLDYDLEFEEKEGADFLGDLADGLVANDLLTREDADKYEEDIDADDILDAMLEIDTNGDGEIDADEGATAIIGAFGLEDTEETREEIKRELKEYLGDYDTNGSGGLDLEEVLGNGDDEEVEGKGPAGEGKGPE